MIRIFVKGIRMLVPTPLFVLAIFVAINLVTNKTYAQPMPSKTRWVAKVDNPQDNLNARGRLELWDASTNQLVNPDFVVKGFDYSPIRMNENLDWMRWLSDEFWDDVPRDPMNGDRIVTNYRSVWASGACQPNLPNGNCRGDIQNIANLGGNMIRVYGMTSRFMPVQAPDWKTYVPDLANQENPSLVAMPITHKQFLDECQKQGVYVLVGFYLNVNFWDKRIWDLQNSEPDIKKQIEWYSKIYREVAAEVGQHPAVLGFSLNNEIDGQDITWEDPTLADFFWGQLQRIASEVKSIAPDKLVGIAFHDSPKLVGEAAVRGYLSRVPSIDFWGCNTYQLNLDGLRNTLYLNDVAQNRLGWSMVPAAAKKPLLYTEFGWPQTTRTIWNSTCEARFTITDRDMNVTNKVANMFTEMHGEIVKKPADRTLKLSPGVFYFQYADEWYKQTSLWPQPPPAPPIECLPQPGPTSACTWMGTYADPNGFPGGWWDEAGFGVYSIRRGKDSNGNQLPNCAEPFVHWFGDGWYYIGPNPSYDILELGRDLPNSRAPLENAIKSVYRSVSNGPQKIAQYSFNGNANDQSWFGHHGVVNGATLTTDRFGFPNSAYEFDGNDVITANLPALGSSYSISAWVMGHEGSPGRREIISGGSPSTAAGHFLYREGKPGEPNRYHADISNVYGPVAGDAAPAEWSHVAVVSDGITIKLYVDGVLQSTTPAGANIAAGPLSIGKIFFAFPGSAGWIGKIDDVSIYKGTLTANDIRTLAEDRPIVRYVFNSTAHDESGYDFHGNVSGPATATDRFGFANRSFNFDGVDDVISHGAISPLGSQYSITAWVYSDDVNATRREILSGGSSGTNNGYYLYRHNGEYRTDLSNVYGPVGASGIKTGQWVHLGVVARNNSVQLYIDGVLQSVKQMSPNIIAGPLSIGKTFFSFSGSTYWKGRIDDVTIHKKALSVSEIALLSSDRPGGQIIARSATVQESATQAEEVEVSKDLTFYPNPTKGEVRISYRSGKVSDLNIQVLDLAGSVLANVKAADKADEQGVAVINLKDTHGLNPGVYLIRFVGGSKHLGTKRVVLE